MIKKFWYTFATEVLAYSKSSFKYIFGIVKQDTAEKLQEGEKSFFLMPKDVTRYKIEIFKPSIQHLFDRSKSLVEIVNERPGYKTRKHNVQFYGKIVEEYLVDFSTAEDRHFIEILSPLYPWTKEHVFEYLGGKDIQVPETIGLGSIIIIEIHKMYEEIPITYEQADRDSSQVKSIEISLGYEPFIFNNPVQNRLEFEEIRNLIKFLYEKSR